MKMDGIITFQTNHNLERMHTLLMENRLLKEIVYSTTEINLMEKRLTISQ